MANNILLNKIATASSCVIPYTPARIVDGAAIPLSRWLCNAFPGWVTVDAGAAFWVNRWVVKLMGNAGWASNYNMAAYTLQASLDNNNWTTIDVVAANTANTTDRTFATISARYFRIVVTSGIPVNPALASIMEFEVYDAPAPNSLSALTLSSGSLVPVFDNAALNYTASVDTDVNSITITPTASIAGATITVAGVVVISGSASQVISLTAGASKTISVVVTANNVVKNYNVVVMRQTSAYLSSVKLAAGRNTIALNPFFLKTTRAYTAVTANTPITATIKTEVDNATLIVSCNGTTLTGSTPTALGIAYRVPLNAGANNTLTIKVTSSTGDVKNYTITITKQ